KLKVRRRGQDVHVTLLFSERGPHTRASFLLPPSAGPGLPPPPAARMAASCPLRRAPRLEAGRGGGVSLAACCCPHGRAASRACQNSPAACRRKKALDKKGRRC